MCGFDLDLLTILSKEAGVEIKKAGVVANIGCLGTVRYSLRSAN